MIVELKFNSSNIFMDVTYAAPIYAEVSFSSFGSQTGGGGGVQNVFIQQSQPTENINYLWVELNPDNSVKTFWINS